MRQAKRCPSCYSPIAPVSAVSVGEMVPKHRDWRRTGEWCAAGGRVALVAARPCFRWRRRLQEKPPVWGAEYSIGRTR